MATVWRYTFQFFSSSANVVSAGAIFISIWIAMGGPLGWLPPLPPPVVPSQLDCHSVPLK
jgi:hypothetical protein